MKILYIITELTPAGAEHVVADLADGMIRRGHAVRVVSLLARPAKTAIVDRLASCGAEVRYLNATKASALSVLFRLRRAVCDFQPDIVHAHLIHPNLLSRFALVGLDIPLVNTIHIAERRSGKGVFFLLDRMTMRLCDALTAVSRASAEYHAKRCGVAVDRIRVIENGIRPVAPASTDECARLLTECGLTGCAKIIGSVGRLDWQKGYDRLLHALPDISARVPSGETWGLVILGEGAARAELERLAERFAVPNIRVVMPGYRANAASLMAAFDAFVMPSRYEGSPLVLAEMMTIGLPCVISDGEAMPDLVRDYPGFARVLHFTDDPTTDGAALASALTDALQARRVAPYCYFGCEEMLAAYHNLYLELTERT